MPLRTKKIADPIWNATEQNFQLRLTKKAMKLWQCIVNCFQHYFCLAGRMPNSDPKPLTYTYLDCLLGVKMRGHKMAEIWEWLLMGSTADQYQDRPAGLLLWFVLVCRVMPRSLMFQDKLQLYKAKSSIFYSCFFILLYVYWKMEFNLFRFSTIIYLLASYCKWFYWTKVD